MSNSIMVSIICMAFNHENFIEKTLEGFLKQKTSFKYEVLIHDDASTDRTAQIIKEYEAKYPDIIKPIFEIENQYSKGIDISKKFNYSRIKGKYVAFCEGDDYWIDENKLELQFLALENNENCSICVHNTLCVNRKGDFLTKVFPKIHLEKGVINCKDYIEYEIKKQPWLFHLTSFFIRSNVYREYLNSAIRSSFPAGDKEIILYSLTRGNCFYIDKDMSCYRVDSGGVMSKLRRDSEYAKNYFSKFIAGYNIFNNYTNYEYSNFVEYRIRCTEIELIKVEGNYKRLRDKKYNDIIKSLSKKSAFVLSLCRIFPKTTYAIFIKKWRKKVE